MTGSGHTDFAVGCQDAFHTNYKEIRDPRRLALGVDDPLILAVADGAGSSRYSAAAATLAVSIATAIASEQLLDYGWDDTTKVELVSLLQHIFTETRRSVESGVRGAIRGHSGTLRLQDFRSTLAVAILRPPWLLTLQVGDGFIVIESGPGSHVLLGGPPPAGEEANMATFLDAPMDPRTHVVQALRCPELTGVALSTDGLETLALDYQAGGPRTPHADLFNPLFRGVADATWSSERILRLLRSPRVLEGTSDDTTLLVATKVPSD